MSANIFNNSQPAAFTKKHTTPPPTPRANSGIKKKKYQMKKSRETIVYLSPRKEGQNLRHQYCKGNLTDRDSRKYFRSLEVHRVQVPSTPSSSSSRSSGLSTNEEEDSSYMYDDDDDNNTVPYDSSDDSYVEPQKMNQEVVISFLSMRKEGHQNLRSQYVKGLLSDRDTRKYMKSFWDWNSQLTKNKNV